MREGSSLLERLLILPFSSSMGWCVPKCSVVVGSNPIKKQRCSELAGDVTRRKGEEKSNGIKRISGRVRILMKRVQSFSHIYVYKQEIEEIEEEMEIGHPTDVKHVTHIGWDGSTTVNPVKEWENLEAPDLLSLPSISLKQFELVKSAQASAPPNFVDS